ncbi:hypothetical protein BBJ28_00000959 [Nothophytophthora sp. Chile5]|nr:hypothetical protein BBJ28_00000959 [Nothophytophthora sp. Chile5]
MPKGKAKGSRAPRRSWSADSVRPNGPTSLDMLLRWVTTPGNAVRWRRESKAELCREIVEQMKAQGIAHRTAQYVRSKLVSIEKKYITAKKWLLETGMHDAFERGKASKDVKEQVMRLCAHYRQLDPVFRGVPFTKNAEPIELDADSTEGGDSDGGEGGAAQTPRTGGAAGAGVAGHDDEINGDESSVVSESSSSEEDEDYEESQDADIAPSFLEQGASVNNSSGDGMGASERVAAQQTNPGKRRKDNNTREEEAQGKDKVAEGFHGGDLHATPPLAKSAQKKKLGRPASSASATSSKVATANAAAKAKIVAVKQPQGHGISKKSHVNGEEKSPPTANGAPKKRRGRPPASALAVSPNVNGSKETVKLALTSKRKASVESAHAAKRARTPPQSGTYDEEVKNIEREALLKRVEEEQIHRRELFELERAKSQCELEAKQVQGVFEKAAARKKLLDMGISQNEIDRVMPL